MAEYSKLAGQLAKVRRAWKRTAALSGLAVTCLETLGVLTVAFLIDWIYSPLPSVRFLLLGIVLVAIVLLLMRHVARPMMRKIPDEQVALFVEEHNDKFEGSLITATEFGGPSSRSTAPAAFVDAVIASAVQRAGQMNLRTILDFRRLRKYGVAALAVLAGYGVLALLVPDVSHRAGRVLTPWHKTQSDLNAMEEIALGKAPVRFELSRGQTSLLRGGTFDLEATLSRRSDDSVTLNYRPTADANGNWRQKPMSPIDKHLGYNGALDDVNEDLEFFVSSGSYHSDSFKISVYDPLVVQSVEVRTQYPAYLKLPDRVDVVSENVATDIVAPDGSKVLVKITANRPLSWGKATVTESSSGQSRQADGQLEGAKGACAIAFAISQDGTYEYEIGDAIGQKLTSSAHGYIRILKDGPPSMEVKNPTAMCAPTPIGEVTFNVNAVDDVAVGSVEVFYERQFPSPEGQLIKTVSGKLPLELHRAVVGTFPDSVEATGRLMLESLEPASVPEEIITYYIECTDRKGQKVTSELQTIAVQHFENWISASTKPPHEPMFSIMKDIEDYVKGSWNIHQSKPILAKADLTKLCKDLADSMYNPDTKSRYGFYNPKKIPLEKKYHAHKADELIDSGHDALLAEDTAKAVQDFRMAAAELKICLMGDRDEFQMLTGDFGKPGNQKEKELKKLAQAIIVEVPKVPIPQDFLDKMKAAEQLKKDAAELEKKQAEIVKKAEEIAKAQQEGQPAPKPENKDPNAQDPNKKDDPNKAADPNKKDDPNKTADPNKKDDPNKTADPNKKDDPTQTADPNKKPDPNQKDDPSSLANKQQKIADDTRKAADQTKADPNADPAAKQAANRMEDAAREMKDATRDLREGKIDDAVAAADRARRQLQQVAAGAEQMRQEKLAKAIEEAEKEAGRILNRQKDLTKETEAIVQKAPQNNPDQQDKEFKKLSYRQAQLKGEMEQVKETVKLLNEWAKREAKPETSKQIEESNRQITRSQPDQKMANAVVELTGQQGAEAVKEQKKAEEALTKVVDNLQKAADSMASDTESELRRVVAEATRIDAGMKKLGVKEPPASQPATQNVAQSQPTTDKTAQDPTKPDQTANQDPTKPKPQPSTGPADDKTLTPQEKKDLAENLAYELDRFAAHLENRQFVEKKDTDVLKNETRDASSLTRKLQEDDPKREELANLVRRAKNKLESEYQAQLDAKRLMAAQKEECPPAYRHLVNKYYEALSQVKK